MWVNWLWTIHMLAWLKYCAIIFAFIPSYLLSWLKFKILIHFRPSPSVYVSAQRILVICCIKITDTGKVRYDRGHSHILYLLNRYMVVVSEDDIICRSCTTMMNNLDRLEKEMSSVRSVILRFLEKKYDLEEGELANTQVVLPPPPTTPEPVSGK